MLCQVVITNNNKNEKQHCNVGHGELEVDECITIDNVASSIEMCY